jgi:hypothetical protein
VLTIVGIGFRTLTVERGGLRRYDHRGRHPGSTPPHPPAQPFLPNTAEAKSSKAVTVLTGREDVGDQQPAAGAQHTDGFVNGFVPLLRAFDVMNGDIGDDQVEACVRKRQCRDVSSPESTRSATPSASAFRRVAASAFPD